MSQYPKASICVMTHNSAATIRYTLNAILNQTFQDFEVVITDDYSIDDTINIVYNEYCAKDDRFKLHLNCTDRDWPYIDAFNKSYQFAKGEYLFRIDHDDIPLPDYLECVIKYIDERLYLDACCTAIYEYESGEYDKIDIDNLDESRKECNIHPYYYKWANVYNACPVGADHLADYVNTTYIFHNQASCIRRSSYERIKPQCRYYALGDVMFWKEFIGQGARIEKIEEYKLLYMGRNASAEWDVPPSITDEKLDYYTQSTLMFYHDSFYTYKGLFYFPENQLITYDTTVGDLKEVMKYTTIAIKQQLIEQNKYNMVPKNMRIE